MRISFCRTKRFTIIISLCGVFYFLRLNSFMTKCLQKPVEVMGHHRQFVESLQTKGDNQRAGDTLQSKGDNLMFRFSESLQRKVDAQRAEETLHSKGGNLTMLFTESHQHKNDDRGFQAVTNEGSLYAYSAYYDPRDKPQVRVNVISTQVFMNISYKCHVELTTGVKHEVPGTINIIKTFLTYKYKYVSAVIKCALQTCCSVRDRVESVSVYPSVEDLIPFRRNLSIPLQNLTINEHKLTVIYVHPGPRTNSLTRCFAALHTYYNRVHKLIWNIEISRLSGADKFIFYNHSISPAVNKVLYQYMKEGIVEVRKWNLPKQISKKLYYFGQMVAEHDCLMSQMYSAKYVLLADLDEIILPRNQLSVVKLADNIFDYHTDSPKTRLGSLPFRCFSFVKSPADEKKLTEAKHLQIEPLLYTRYFVPFADSRKALVIPERIDRMCVHNACFLQSGFEEKIVRRREGVLLHFRDVPRHLKPNTTFQEFHGLMEYSDVILAAITKRRNILNV